MTNERSTGVMHPLAFAILAATTPPEIETVLYDDRIEEIPYDDTTDLVAISVETFTAYRSYKIAQEFKKRNISVVMGGFHPSILPDEALPFCDAVVIGDAEQNWRQVITDLQNGNLKKVYKNQHPNQLLLTRFDRTIFKNKKYSPVNLVQWGRGCPHQCDFCSIIGHYKKKQFIRSISDVITELESLDKKPVFFVDDNLYHNKKDFEHFLKALIPLELKWACQISSEVTKDIKLIELMRKSGCFMVLLGIESFHEENLKLMNKRWNYYPQSYEKVIRTIQDNGMMIYGTFIFGYDHDSIDCFDRAVDFAIKHKFFMANFNPLYPMPGTTLYDRLLSQNLLLHKQWWTDPEFYFGKSIFTPKKMTPKELEMGSFDAKKKFNSYYSILKRSLNFSSNFSNLENIGLYLLANYTNRKEIYRKQGKMLG
jgi:radical SAM superfamily enzyme YgiQ (UPF0313 family)